MFRVYYIYIYIYIYIYTCLQRQDRAFLEAFGRKISAGAASTMHVCNNYINLNKQIYKYIYIYSHVLSLSLYIYIYIYNVYTYTIIY